jgi:hypothetical protein
MGMVNIPVNSPAAQDLIAPDKAVFALLGMQGYLRRS